MFADLALADLRRIAARRQTADGFAALPHQKIVETVFVREHEVERRLPHDDLEQFGVERDARESRDPAHRRRQVAIHVFVAEHQHVRVVALFPPRQQVMPVVALAAAPHVRDARERLDRHAAGFEPPAFHEAERRNERVLRIANRHDVARPFGDQVIRQMALVAARLPALRRVEVEAEFVRGFDPRNHARDVVEVHVAAGSQAVEDLLDPRRAAFAVRRDDHVGGLSDGTRGLSRSLPGCSFWR